MFDFLWAPGTADIKTDKISYSKGDKICGKVILNMKKPKNARCLRLELYAERRTPYTTSQGRRSNRNVRIYEFKTDLDGEHEYTGIKEYDFTLDIPGQDSPQATMDGIAGTAMSIAHMAGMTAGPPQWFIKASLDIPHARDVSKRIQINVG
jgi:hypothetical protein